MGRELERKAPTAGESANEHRNEYSDIGRKTGERERTSVVGLSCANPERGKADKSHRARAEHSIVSSEVQTRVDGVAIPSSAIHVSR